MSIGKSLRAFKSVGKAKSFVYSQKTMGSSIWAQGIAHNAFIVGIQKVCLYEE
jgi:hypothetical protein